MQKLERTLTITRTQFNQIPKPVKVMIYSGLGLIVATLINDIEKLNGEWVKYAAIVLGIASNYVAWKVLSFKDEK